MTKQVPVASSEELEETVVNLALQGYSLVTRSSRRAVLVKKKTFNIIAALVWGVLLFLVGFAVYLAVYALKKDEYLEVFIDEGADHDNVPPSKLAP